MVTPLFNNTHTTVIGTITENAAQHFLENQGLTLVEKNFRIDQINGKEKAEIDLIMQHNMYLVFVEVKFRTKNNFGHPLEMVSATKQKLMIRAATYFLQARHLYNTAFCRFDVVGIEPDAAAEQLKISWVQNAFWVN